MHAALLLAALAQPSFEAKEIDKSLTVGYGVVLADVNGDGKPDVVVADAHRVLWYENPSWKRRTVLQGKTARDNVCLAAHDIDRDGKIDLALGAGWQHTDTKGGGTLQWLRQPKDLDSEWEMFAIGREPSLHRVRFLDLDGTGKPALVTGPLFGRGSTGKANWTDGRPLRLQAYRIPAEPRREPWPVETLDESLHVMHNFAGVPRPGGKGEDLLTASYLGVHRLSLDGKAWRLKQLGAGDQSNPKGSRGASEIKPGKLKGGDYIATVEPWHGHQVVVYTPGKPGELWTRRVLDDQLRWGHAVWCGDLDGDGEDEVVIGVRDNLSGKEGQRCGVRVYKCLDGKGEKWRRAFVDEGGVAVEDLACADLDGDGRIDIVAVGRATKNVRVYRNVGKK